jgi:hypothetical protein
MRAATLLNTGRLREGVGRLLDPLIDWRNALRSGPKVVYLHIGAHKTGTTAIQSMLRAEQRRLRWHGFFYDRAFYRLGKVLATHSPLSDGDRDRLRREVDARLRGRPEPNIIGSSEALFGNLFASYANIRVVAEDLRVILADYDVRIVGCIRRQDDFIQSVYHQYVKRGGTLRFDAFLQTHDVRAYRWNELLAHYADVFGRRALSVVAYEALFQTPTALLERLFAPLAAAGFRTVKRPSVRNPSLSPKGIEIAIRCNELLDSDEQLVLRRFLQSTFNQKPGEKHALFTEEQRRDLLRFYADSNRKCMEEFLDQTSASASYVSDTHPQKLRALPS